MSNINLKNDEMINELRERGLYLLVIGPNDVKGYELEDGKVEMTDKEAVQLIAQATKGLDSLLTEEAWELVGSYVQDFKNEKDAHPEGTEGQDRESYSDTQDRENYTTGEC